MVCKMGKKNKKNKEVNVIDETQIKLDLPDPEEEQPKENIVVEKFNMYKFIFKILAFAVLVTFGILILVYKEGAIGAIYLITGIVAGFAAIIRVIPLLRTLKSGKARLICFCEILLHLLIGAYLISAALVHWKAIHVHKELEDLTGMAKFNLTAYKYILVALLYTRAICYFWITILFKEETDKVRFWLHVIVITVAIVLAAIPLTPQRVVYALVVLAFVCAVVIGGEAGTGYYRYRKSIAKPKEKDKEKKKEKKPEIEAPGKQDEPDISEIDPNTIPINEPVQDNSIVS